MKAVPRWLLMLIQKYKVRLNGRWDFDGIFGGGFLTWHRRPKRTIDWTYLPEKSSVSDVGLVIQGPWIKRHNFTLETIGLYKSSYPNVPMCLSTWEGMSAKDLENCKNLGVFVIQNKPSDSSFSGNLTKQQQTSIAGLEYLQKQGVSYSIKTRADQRIYSAGFIESLLATKNLFPPAQTQGKKIACRIFLSYQNSFLNRYLGGSDFFQFGQTSDILNLWNSIDASKKQNQIIGLTSEQIILGSYLSYLGWPIENLYSMETWNRAMAEVIGFVDHCSLDLFWLKYSSREYLWRRYGKEPLIEIKPRNWYEAMAQTGLKLGSSGTSA